MQTVKSRARPAAAQLSRILFVDAAKAHVRDAAYIGVQLGERGYRPIHSGLTLDDLNNGAVPHAVAEAAIAGSMFGWDVPAARAAVRWFREARGEFIA